MRQRVGFARALVVEPEVLFMDEPFSALDVLTAENLRSELLELWQKKTIPTRAIFLVTHNIEEAVLLADRIIVLGRNPGHVRTDFRVTLPQPRDRKSPLHPARRLHLQGAHPAGRAAQHTAAANASPSATSGRCTIRCCPMRGPAASPVCLKLLIDHGGKDDIYRLADELAIRDRRSAPHRRRRAAARFSQGRGGRRRHHPTAAVISPTRKF